MKAYVAHDSGDLDRLRLETLPDPKPARGEVVIRVMAAALNPIDLHALRGALGDRIRFPAILGTDVSGVVSDVGADVRHVHVGDPVFGMINFPGTDGTLTGRGYAEYAQTPATQVAPKPAGMSFEEAAALPVVGLTAKQALEDTGALQRGWRVLIHGASGGIGHIAVQIAKQHGAQVFATASAQRADFVRRLGADEVLDYRRQPFHQAMRDLDLVLDTVGGDTLRRSLAVLRPGGILVTARWPELKLIAADAARRGIEARAVQVKPYITQLTQLANDVTAGKLTIHIDRTYRFDELPTALAQLRSGGTQGKIVVKIG
jgi:NADPH:quinone reductase-like Zn-dependent oxidoreductase